MTIPGYAGRLLRVDLSQGKCEAQELDEPALRKYLGGTGLGARILYDEVPPEIEWSDPRNRLILASGPLGGTTIKGSGTFCVVTKGAQTNGATSTQANGFFGAYIRLSGFDGVVVQGKASSWVYLYIHDGTAELRDAEHLQGKDTWEIEDALKKELGLSERGASVFGIGPAGENLVRFAAIVGDRGHVAAHNGPGAVMGSKKLKAIVVARGQGGFKVKDRAGLKAVADDIFEKVKNAPGASSYLWGTSLLIGRHEPTGVLPVKNYTTNIFPECVRFTGDKYRTRYQLKRNPCWACQMHHCHIMTVPDGPYAGYVGEEPEYEIWAACGPVIGVTDVDAAFVLCNDVDRLGMDGNESGWVMGFAMECFQKGILSGRDTGGLELTWGNAEAARALLRQIAYRQGLGDILAEGVMRASARLGGEARDIGIFTKKGANPRGHDHRARWFEMFDTCVSNTGTIEAPIGGSLTDPFNPENVVDAVVGTKWAMPFRDSLGICNMPSGSDLSLVIQALNAATGWDYTLEEANEMGRRTVNLMRAFNIRCGITPDVERPSPRYGSTPVDGPVRGKSIAPHWDGMLRRYYEQMGWDEETGKPLPETLRALGLEEVAGDVWPR